MLDTCVQDLIEKIRSYYEKLLVNPNFFEEKGEREGHLNNILSALRGPDGVMNVDRRLVIYTESKPSGYNSDPLDELKRLTTCRIRAIIGYKFVGNFINYQPLCDKEIRMRDILLDNFAYPHFKRHYLSAVYTIKTIYGYDLSTEKLLEESK